MRLTVTVEDEGHVGTSTLQVDKSLIRRTALPVMLEAAGAHALNQALRAFVDKQIQLHQQGASEAEQGVGDTAKHTPEGRGMFIAHCKQQLDAWLDYRITLEAANLDGACGLLYTDLRG